MLRMLLGPGGRAGTAQGERAVQGESGSRVHRIASGGGCRSVRIVKLLGDATLTMEGPSVLVEDRRRLSVFD